MKKLSLLLFIAVYIFLCFASNDIEQLRIKESDLRKHKRVYKVLAIKPLHVIFEGFDVTFLSCVVKNEILYFFSDSHTLLNYKNGTAVLQIPGLQDNLETRIDCSVNNKNTTKSVKLYIKTVNRILSAVDGEPLQFELKETPEYEGITKHLCDEGEIVDLTCSKCLNDGRLKLRYYDQNGTKMAESDEVRSEDPLNFRLLVRAENDRSYVDCTHVTHESHNRREFTYRVIFMIRDKSPKNNVFIITINGMELISSSYQRVYEYGVFKANDTYHYKFIYSNKLNITCEKSDKSIVSDNGTGLKLGLSQKADLYMGVELMDIKQERSLYNPSVQIYSIETKNLDKAIMKINLIDLNEKRYYYANIKFYMDDRDGPAILGLPQSNIIYQYNKSATEWFIHYQYVVDEVLRLTCVGKNSSLLEWVYGENIKSSLLLNRKYWTRYISYNFLIDTKTNKTITCKTKNERGKTRKTTIVLHMISDLPSPVNQNDLKVNRETEIPEIIPETHSKALEIIDIIGIVVGFLVAIMCAVCCWWLKKRAEVTKDKQLSRSAGDDYNRVKELTDQTESSEYEYIESNNNTHPDALNADQESSTPIKAPNPPPRSALPSKITRYQISPRGGISHREMEQCKCSTNQRSGLECAHIENEYDYVYGVKKKCQYVASSNRRARKPLRRDGVAFVPHRVPAHQ